jgi:tetratricopeptide (TPR) repeat protein
MSKKDSRSQVSDPSPDEIRTALGNVVASKVFGGSLRLRNFLIYVVEESLDGRGDKIPAKLISEDVYKRPAGASADSDNVVRVDAGRLRRRLDQYYLDAGKNDPVRIHIDPGGYAPRFERQNTLVKSHLQNHPKRRHAVMATSFLVGAFLVAGIVFISGSWLTEWQSAVVDGLPPKTDNASQDLRVLERQAILEKSPMALQAVNMAEQARGLMFPLFDLERLKLTTEMFRQTIRLDDTYFGGYAGAAQTLGSLAFFSPPGPMRANFQTEAQEMADKALRLDPAHSWTQSAAAWTAFTGKDFDRAFRLSNRAMELDPENGNILDFHGIISLFSGNFKSASDAADPIRPRTPVNQRFANRNIYAAANFHLGEYTKTIKSFKTAAEVGDPLSAPALVYMAAAYHAMGEVGEAERKAKELSTAWPNFKADRVLRRIYRHREHADAIVSRLLAAGWVSPSGPNSSAVPE